MYSLIHAALIICLALVAHAVRGRSGAASSTVSPAKKIGVIVTIFVAFWLTLLFWVPILAWAFWIGDNEHWFGKASPYVATAASIALIWPAVHRIFANAVDRRFLWTQVAGSITVVGLWGGFWCYQMLHPIAGTTPQEVVFSVLRNYGLDPNDYVLLESSDENFPTDPERFRTFLVMGATEPRARITVQRYLKHWWKQVGVFMYPPSSEELARAKQWMTLPHQRDGARNILRHITESYPDTPAALEAQQLLIELDETTAGS
jgi:hypothetical protein